jgi:predicted nucleic acid-binding protein
MPTRIYVDTSAAAKLFIAERETVDMRNGSQICRRRI